MSKRDSETAGLEMNQNEKKNKPEGEAHVSDGKYAHKGQHKNHGDKDGHEHGHVSKEDHKHVHGDKDGHEHGHGDKDGHKHEHGNKDTHEHGHGHGHSDKDGHECTKEGCDQKHGHGHSHGDGHGHEHHRYKVKANVEKANQEFSEGQKFFNMGQLSNALRLFTLSIKSMGFPSQEEIRDDPNCAAQALEQISGATWLILYYRAITFFKLGNFTDASQDAGRALKLFERRFKNKAPTEEEKQNYASTLWVRGSSLMEFGAYKEAQKHVSKAVDLNPNNPAWVEALETIEEQVEHSKKMAEIEAKRMPVTIITGFLGSGKTTLVNHILSAKHGMKLAVIENEYGQENIDEALLGNKRKETSNEVIVEASNGCICCTVRGDLIKSVEKLCKEYKDLNGILIETTGMADPTPVAQTFYFDETVRQLARLDGIVTVVDSKHLLQNLAEKKQDGAVNECKQQLAFADVVLVNKTDLVSKEELSAVKSKIKGVNATAKLIETQRSKVDPSILLGINAFNVERVMNIQPDFLEDRETAHDESVTSFVIRLKAPVDMEEFQDWIHSILRVKSADLYRSKGLLYANGSENKFVFHTVHEIMEIEESVPWGENEKRQSTLVFIGKNLDRKAIEEELKSVIA